LLSAWQVQGDITNAAAVSEAVRGADAIIHIAAFGMSGSAQVPSKKHRKTGKQERTKESKQQKTTIFEVFLPVSYS
jgi:hypothetical protein